MPTYESAEITRTDLAQTLLQMSKLNITDVMSFPFMEKPTEEYFVRAIDDLIAIGAMDAGLLTITPHGQKIMKLALEPCLANALIRSAEHGCTEEMLIIVALISVDYAKVFYKPPDKDLREAAMEKWRELTSDAGDHLTLLNVYRKWTVDGGCGWQWCQDNFVYFQTMKNAKKLVDQIGRQLAELGVRRSSCDSQHYLVQAALAASFSDKAASHYAEGLYFWLADKCQSFEYRMRVMASADSVLHASRRKLVICHRVITSISMKTCQMLLVTEVEKDMLPESVRAKVPADERWTPGDELKQAWLASQNPPTSQASARREFSLANYDGHQR
ncbi:Helicase-associated domain containing protein [Aphelenchoides avenae]|nr:Helicase-associated domain containing protein [Aphelenchus avenae]